MHIRPTLISLFLIFGLSSHALVNVVTTTKDMQALVEAIGGDKVSVDSIAKGTQDAHRIEAKPSFMVRVAKADLVVLQGLNLEAAWIDPLVRGSRNPKVQKGTSGYLELGSKLNPIDAHQGPLTRADGDIHPEGNPHFHLDVQRMIQAAHLVADRLGELNRIQAEEFKKNSKKYEADMKIRLEDWKARVKRLSVSEIVTYHKTFSYFCQQFGIICKLQLEPKPGIPPTTSHLMEVLAQMKLRNIKVVWIENYFDGAIRSKIKSQIPGSQVILTPVSVGGEIGIQSTQDLLEHLITLLENKDG